MFRHSLFAAALALPLLLTLSACGGRTTAELQTDVQTIATGLSGIATDLAAVPSLNIPPAQLEEISRQITLIQSNASQIAGVLTPGQPVIKDFVESVVELGTLVQPFFPQAPTVAALITAAASLAQVVLQESGALSVSPSRVWTMPPATARQVLQQVR